MTKRKLNVQKPEQPAADGGAVRAIADEIGELCAQVRSDTLCQTCAVGNSETCAGKRPPRRENFAWLFRQYAEQIQEGLKAKKKDFRDYYSVYWHVINDLVRNAEDYLHMPCSALGDPPHDDKAAEPTKNWYAAYRRLADYCRHAADRLDSLVGTIETVDGEKKRGRRQLRRTEAAKRTDILLRWAQDSGKRSREEFCGDELISVGYLETCQGWDRQRTRRRSEQKPRQA